MTQQEGDWEYTPGLILFHPAGDFYCQRKENLSMQSVQVSIPGHKVNMRGEWNWKGPVRRCQRITLQILRTGKSLFSKDSLWQINFLHSCISWF